MSELEKLISELVRVAEHPAEAVGRAIGDSGKRAVGCFLGFLPEELIDAAGFLPVGLWGEDREIEKARQYYPAFFCAPIQQMLEQAMGGEFDGLLSAVVMPVYCDALRSAGENFKTAVPHIPVLSAVYPANRTWGPGKKFLASEYRKIGAGLEKLSGHAITGESLERSIVVYNEYRMAMREFVKAAAQHPDKITPYLRHMIIKASYCMDKRNYTVKIRTLTKRLSQAPQTKWDGKRVVLTGILLDSERLLKKMESLDIAVASDFLLQESLQFQTDVPEEGEDPYYRLACRFGQLEYCPVAMDPEKKRTGRLCREALEQRAGVMICIPSFCDPEEYDYPLLKQALEENGISHICLELNTSSVSSQAETLLQTFAEL